MKDHCNALFLTEETLANHERFGHSEHPLAGDDFLEIGRTDEKIRREKVQEVTNLEIEGLELSE